MRRYTLIWTIILLFATLALAGCGETEKDRLDDVLEATVQGDCSFSPQGGTFAVALSHNVTYQIAYDADWMHQVVSRSLTSSRVTFTVDKNTSAEERSCTVTFSGGEAVKEITVYQSAPCLKLEKDDIVLDATRQSFSVTVECNVPYSFDLDDLEWISVSGSTSASENGSRAYTLLAEDNKQLLDREATVVFASDEYGLEHALHIRQQALDIMSAELPGYEFGPEGGSFMLDRDPAKQYTFSAGEASWVAISAAADHENRLVVDIAPNASGADRSAALTVTCGTQQRQIDIFQTSAALTLSAQRVVFGPDGGSETLCVSANVDYSATLPGQDSWCTAEAASDGVYTITAGANLSGQERTCSLVFSNAEYGMSYTVEIVQTVKEPFELSPQEVTVPQQGGTLEICAPDREDLTVMASADWIVPSGTTPDGMYQFTVLENTGSQAREGYITFTSGNDSAKVTVTQQWGAFFKLDTDFFELPAAASVVELSLSTNQEYTYTISEDWISDAGDLKFAVAANHTGRERTGRIVFNADGEEYVVNICQQEPWLLLSAEDGTFDPLGGKLTVRVFANVSYTLQMPSESWISVLEKGDGEGYEFLIEKNDTREGRSCEITFASEEFSLSRTVRIQQSGVLYFEVEQSSFVVGPMAGEITIRHNPCEDVALSMPQSEWIREDESKRTQTQIVLGYDTNLSGSSREVALSLAANGFSVDVSIVQQAPRLYITSTNLQVAYDGEKIDVDISANFPVEIAASEDWVSCVVDADKGLAKFSVLGNSTGAQRTAVVTLSGSTWGISREVTVVQAANPVLELESATLDVGWEGGDFYVNVTSNVTVHSTTMVTWASCTATDDPQVFLIHVDANSDPRSRSCIVFFSGGGMQKTLTLSQSLYLNTEYYCSQDYSADGQVQLLQHASVGNGINVVIMGDAFSDRLIADGTYSNLMNQAAEALFSVEPFTTFRDMFNVYSVTLVSPNEIYADDSATALLTKFETGTNVSGDHVTVMSVATNAIEKVNYGASFDTDNLLVIVVMNAEVYAGTTYLYRHDGLGGDYGIGEAIVYLPRCTSDDEFAQVLRHEACGHGFGKLADEYAYPSVGAISETEIENYQGWKQIGFYKNVDFTSDPAQVLWAKFLSDERYQYDGLGVFEGACTFTTGIFRPSENSIMRYNTGLFNAPSREAIYYRLHRLAYGTGWTYNFEDFAAYDAVNRQTAPEPQPAPKRKLSYTPSVNAMLPPPVMIVK